MSGNTLGKLFKVTTWGESHGAAIGCVIDGCPSGIRIDETFIRTEMARRAPGQSCLTTPRVEQDLVKILSGLHEGVTTGTPLSLLIENTNTKSGDYDNLKTLYRPGHADYSYQTKYGIRDHRGGGRSSARTTAALVAAGAIAKQVLQTIQGFEILAYVTSVGTITGVANSNTVTRELIEKYPIRCPDHGKAEEMVALVQAAATAKDSVGGVIECVVRNIPAGLGEPVFDKLDADLAKAMLCINASKGFELGSGFAATRLKGSENNDKFVNHNGRIETETNNAGGIIGGISTGMPIVFRVAFKPTPTIGIDQETIDIDGNRVKIAAAGRHDPCVLPRAVAVVEAMASLVLCDHYLLSKNDRLFI